MNFFWHIEYTLEYFSLLYDVMLQNYFVKNTSIINFFVHPVILPSRVFFSECLLISAVHSIMGGVFVFVI